MSCHHVIYTNLHGALTGFSTIADVKCYAFVFTD